MIPILYGGDEVNFLSNGLGRLTDAISCVVTEERNGTFELEMEYPINGIHFDDIQIGTIIYTTHDASKDPQPFEVYMRSSEIDGVVTFCAHHISYRLNTIVCMPFSLTNASVADTFTAIKNHAASTVPFFFYTDKTNSANYTLNAPNTIRQMLGGEENSILDVYGTGEYKFDKWNVTLYVNRGSDRGVNVRYGKNMTDLEEERSVENRYSAAVPYWVNAETGEIMTLPEIAVVASSLPTDNAFWTTEDDTIMRTNNGTELEFNYPIIEYVPMDLSDEWEEAPTVSRLRTKAQNRLENSQAWLTDENLSVDFTLGDLPEELNYILLCDTVGVYYPALGVEVKKKVIKTEYNSLLECYNSIELGNPKTSLFSAIEQRTGDLLQGYVRRSYMAAAIENATNLITGGTGGYVVFGFNADGKPEEILIMDTDNTATAVNVIRMNRNGIGFSTTGYQGPFTSAWTIDGHFVADFIDSGTLNANLLKAGTITGLTGGNSWNLNNGLFVSTDGTRKTQISAGRIAFYKDDTATGYIRPAAWGGDHENAEGVTLLAAADAQYLGIGHEFMSGGNYYATSDIVINNGLNPGGHEEKVLIRSGTHFNQSVTFGGSIRPDVDYPSTAINCGSSSNRWYQVWSSSFNFTTGVYINYSSANDYIYSSKTIHQASDENLKNVLEYDEKYDALLDELEPILYTWKSNPGKIHAGLGARKTATTIERIGIKDSGFVGIDYDEDGNEVYSVDYQELAVMLLHKYQKENKSLKEKVASLEDRLNKLEKRLEVMGG